MYNPQPGRIVGKHLTTTSQTTIYTQESGVSYADHINFANITASAATARLHVTVSADSDTYALFYDVSVPAGGLVRVDLGYALNKDDAIKATAGTANALDVVLSIIEAGRY